MIISSRRKPRSSMEDIFAMFRGTPPKAKAILMTEPQISLEIIKERGRLERRGHGFFALIWLRGFPKRKSDVVVSFCNEVLDRVRLTDSVGLFQDGAILLLPETDREGARILANEILKLGQKQEFDVETEIVVFPFDEGISQGADEFGEFVAGKDTAAELQAGNEASIEKAVPPDLEDGHQSACFQMDFSRPTPWWKRGTDLAGAVVGLSLLSPVFLLAAASIKLSSPGPVFFRQTREGKGGKHFQIYKFRTMRIDAESLQEELKAQSEQDGPAFKIENDPRITFVGKYLRKSCIDELPQLVNILKGEMSLVGPRPLPVHESTACRIWQRRRLQVLPGLTCIWQVFGGRQTKFVDWMRMDMEYIEKQSFWFDLRLIFQTALVALLHRGSV